MSQTNSTDLVLIDITTNSTTILKGDAYTVQHFSYQCLRERNADGLPVGPIQPSYMSFTIRVGNNLTAKGLMDLMWKRDPYPFSFLFNASFLTTGNLKLNSYEEALVVRAYPVEVEEFKDVVLVEDSTTKEKTNEEQMLVRVKLLLCQLIYATEGNNYPKMLISSD